MTAGLSERQQAVVAFVVRYQDVHGSTPTTRQIADGLGLRSPRVAWYHLGQIARKGYSVAQAPDFGGLVARRPDYAALLAERFGPAPAGERRRLMPDQVGVLPDSPTEIARRRRVLAEALKCGRGRRAEE